MSLIYCDGFDTYGLAGQSQASGTIATGGWSNVSAVYSNFTRGGIGMSADLTGYGYMSRPFDTAGEIVFGFAFYVGALEFRTLATASLDNYLGTLTQKATIYTNPTGALTIVMPGPNNTPINLFSPVNSIFANSWFYLEGRIKFSPNSDGIVELRVDGDTVLSYVGATCDKNPMANLFGFGQGGFGGVPKFVDDFYLLRNDGVGLCSFLGDCVVHSLVPVSDAGPNAMTQTGGSQTHASAVGEFPSDEDTSYLESANSGDTEWFNLSTIPNDSIEILGVMVDSRVKKSAAGVASFEIGLRSNSQVSWSTPIYPGLNYIHRCAVFEKDPNGGLAWSKTALQAAQVGFTVV